MKTCLDERITLWMCLVSCSTRFLRPQCISQTVFAVWVCLLCLMSEFWNVAFERNATGGRNVPDIINLFISHPYGCISPVWWRFDECVRLSPAAGSHRDEAWQTVVKKQVCVQTGLSRVVSMFKTVFNKAFWAAQRESLANSQWCFDKWSLMTCHVKMFRFYFHWSKLHFMIHLDLLDLSMSSSLQLATTVILH